MITIKYTKVLPGLLNIQHTPGAVQEPFLFKILVRAGGRRRGMHELGRPSADNPVCSDPWRSICGLRRGLCSRKIHALLRPHRVHGPTRLGLAAVQLIPTLELTRHSLRIDMSFKEFTLFAVPPVQLLQPLFPYLFGGSTSSLYAVEYFGRWNMWELVGYVGLMPRSNRYGVLPWQRPNVVLEPGDVFRPGCRCEECDPDGQVDVPHPGP